jgi:hypothetical protein
MELFRPNKNWYKVNDSVTYSVNFRYFIEHEVEVIEVDRLTKKIVSKIDNRLLELIKVNPHEGFDLEYKLKVLHTNLLKGQVYKEKGVFVN